MPFITTSDGTYEVEDGKIVGRVYDNVEEELTPTEFRRFYEGWSDITESDGILYAISHNPDDLLPYSKGDVLSNA